MHLVILLFRRILILTIYFGRLRDVCVSPDGKIYLATSNQDGRANSPFPTAQDDRIIEIVSLNVSVYCNAEQSATICPGETYNFYGLEISQPGTYYDTIPGGKRMRYNSYPPDQYFWYLESIGLEDSVMMALDDTVTLTANEGFISYKWNDDPPSQDNTITIIASELGVGTHFYTIEVEDAKGCACTDTITLIVTPVVGIEKFSDLEFSVYPNPVKGDELNVDYRLLLMQS